MTTGVRNLGGSSVPFVSNGTSCGIGSGSLVSLSLSAGATAGATSVGVDSLRSFTSTVAVTGPTAIGYSAASSLTTGSGTAQGWKAGATATVATNWTAFGGGALQFNTASFQVAVGELAMNLAVTPNQCAVVGSGALQYSLRPQAMALVGYKAGQGFDDDASNNSGIGNAIFLGNGVTRITGTDNFAGGSHNQRYITTASFNAIVGGEGGAEAANPLTTGSRNSGLGYFTFKGMVVQVNDAVALGANTRVQGNGGIAAGSGSYASAIYSIAIGMNVTSAHAGSVVLGVKSDGTSSTTSATNQVILGTASHSVLVPGTLGVTGASTFAAVTATTVAGSNITASGTLGVTGISTLAIIRNADGTTGAPAYSFTSDTTSGLYLAAVGEVRMNVASSVRQRWQASLVTMFVNVRPSSTNALDLGDASVAWRDVFVGRNLIHNAVTVGNGLGVMGIGNASTVPTTNPVGGGTLYAEAGALKWRGSGGTVTVLAAA